MKQKIDFLFYCPEIEETLVLSELDSQHAIKVLRRKIGDEIQITDGKGGLFYCIIAEANPKKCRVEIKNFEREFGKSSREIHVAICPTKNMDRIEYFVEKSVEIGVSSFYFVLSQNTYPKKINRERIQKIAVSAMKQSLKCYLPKIFDAQKIELFFQNTKALKNKYIAHLGEDFKDITKIKMQDDVLILIGPEGDFSKNEIEAALKNDFQPVKMGESRLRTETAGVVAVTLLNLLK